MLVHLLVVAVCLLAAPTVAYAGAADGDGISRLNELRAANGIPAGIIENKTWSQGCALHLRYLDRNGTRPNPHDEQPGLPGYTALGDEAANNAVLGSETPWPGDGRTPWEDAPLHLAQTLAPALMVSGYRPGCLWTWSGYRRSATAPRLYSYPGDGTSIYRSHRATEWPFTPGDFVGLPQGTTTGPHLFLLGHGIGRSHLTTASVTGPNGSVELRMVDNHTRSTLGDAGRLLPPGTAIIIPVTPLEANADYRVTATMTEDGGQSHNLSFSFSTTSEERDSESMSPWRYPLVIAVCISVALLTKARRHSRFDKPSNDDS